MDPDSQIAMDIVAPSFVRRFCEMKLKKLRPKQMYQQYSDSNKKQMAQGGEVETDKNLQENAFVIPADVVGHIGDGSSDELNSSYLPKADIVFCAARAGTQVINIDQINLAKSLKVIADVNAVPPAGIEGVSLNDDDTKHPCGAYSIGPLTSGDIKVKTQYKMFENMCTTDKPLYLNFKEALDISRNILRL